MLDGREFYPPHEKRAESPAYASVHHQMTVVDDRHCLVRGVHHRHKFAGVHAITYPIWGPQDVVDATLIAAEIGAAAGSEGDV